MRRHWNSKGVRIGAAAASAAVGLTHGQAHADVTYTYTGRPFDVAACVQQFGTGNGTVCVAGNITATFTFGAEVTPGFTGQTNQQVAATFSVFGTTLKWPSDPGIQKSAPGTFTFEHGGIKNWVFGVSESRTNESIMINSTFLPGNAVGDLAYINGTAAPNDLGKTASPGIWSKQNVE
jgi:hypothetical protein